MKNSIYTFAFLLVSVFVCAQTQTENYVKTTTAQVPVQTEATFDTLNADDKIESITYFDGLGRPIQTIAKQAGGQKQDIITIIMILSSVLIMFSYRIYSNEHNVTLGSDGPMRQRDICCCSDTCLAAAEPIIPAPTIHTSYTLDIAAIHDTKHTICTDTI